MSAIFIYITCKEQGEAEKIARTLLEERLVACANIMAPHQSLYWWEGKIQNEQEVALIMKSQDKNFETIKEKILELHSYDCPCIVAWPISQGHGAFLQWIEGETKVS